MPTTVTFTSLLDDMRNYLERGGSAATDPTVYNQLPRLVNAAERKLAQVLKLQGQIEVLVDAPAGLQTGNSVVTKPDRWRQTVSLNYGSGETLDNRTPLFPRSYEYCRYYWPNSLLTGAPEFYADYSLSAWLIVPTPDQNYPLEVLAYMQPPLLDSSNQSNFFSDYTPNLLLYGALLEAEPFIKDDTRIATWKGYWAEELATLNQQDLEKILDRAAQRKRP